MKKKEARFLAVMSDRFNRIVCFDSDQKNMVGIDTGDCKSVIISCEPVHFLSSGPNYV